MPPPTRALQFAGHAALTETLPPPRPARALQFSGHALGGGYGTERYGGKASLVFQESAASTEAFLQVLGKVGLLATVCSMLLDTPTGTVTH